MVLMHHVRMRCGGNVLDLLLGYFHRQTRDLPLKPAPHYLDWTFRLGRATFGSVASVFKLCLSVEAADSGTLTESNSTHDSPKLGVLNYRTREFDDGLDPLGWYDLD